MKLWLSHKSRFAIHQQIAASDTNLAKTVASIAEDSVAADFHLLSNKN